MKPFPADSWVILAVGNDGQFRRFCAIVGMDADERFATNAQRLEHRAELSARIGQHTRQWLREDLLAMLEQGDVPAGPINSVADAFADPQIVARGMKLTMRREGGTEISGVRLPIRFSRSQLAPASASPLLGRDTKFVIGRW